MRKQAAIEHTDETRERLLLIAARLFAENGFNKVTVRAICQEAHTNLAAVNYHFRDKLTLYKEVVQMVADMMDRAKSEAFEAGAGQSPDDQLRSYIRIFLHRLLDPEEDSWMDKLILRELMDPTPALDLIIEKGIKPSSERLRRLVGRLLDLPPDDWRVIQCAVSIQGQCLFYRMSKPVAIRWQPSFKYTPEVIDGLAHHVAEFSLAGIRATGRAIGGDDRMKKMKRPDLNQRELLDKLYRDFHPLVFNICRHLLGSPDEAEDAANEVFARLPAALRSYDPVRPFERWLSKVAGNYCFDVLRKRRSEQRVLEPVDPEAPEPAAPVSSPLHDLLGQEQRAVLRNALVRLQERYFVPLVMRYYSELSYDEIAEALGTNRTRVAVLIFRAKQKLERVLAEQAAERKPERHNERTRPRGTPLAQWLDMPAFGLPGSVLRCEFSDCNSTTRAHVVKVGKGPGAVAARCKGGWSVGRHIPFILKNCWRNRRRTILTVASMGVSICLLGVLLAIYHAFYYSNPTEWQALRMVTRNRVSLAFPMPQFYREKIAQIPGVKMVGIEQWFGGTYIDSRPEHMFARFAAEPDKVFLYRGDLTMPDDQKKAFEQDRAACVASRDLAAKQHWQIGDRINLMGDIFPVNLELTLKGIFDDPRNSEILFFNREYLEQSMSPGRRGNAGTFDILANSKDDVPRIERAVDSMFENSPVQTKTETESAFELSFVAMLGNIKVFLLSICAAVTFTILLVSANTIAMSVRERVREVGVLKTLGYTRNIILGLVLGEALALSLAGGVLGLLLASGLANLVRHSPVSFFTELKNLTVVPPVGALCILLAGLIGMLSAFLPAFQASRISIVEALRSTE